MEHFNFNSTPCMFYKILSDNLNVKLFVKHDDYFELCGGGNKARKLCYILKAAEKKLSNAVVTAGGIQSNHVRATALMCAQLGWKSTMVIHAKQPKEEVFTGNLKITQLCGSKIQFISKEKVAISMDNAMDELKNEGYNPYYIWGGGHCIEGTYAYYDSVREVKNQLKPEDYPDFIFLASGTGTTQAGIIAGCNKYLPNTKVVGISVARDSLRGIKVIQESLDDFNKFLGFTLNQNTNILFDDMFVGKEYESTYPDLIKIIKWTATKGLIVDPTYTGKAFLGMVNYIKRGIVPKNSKVLFWHTGGNFNLMSSKKI